MNTRSTHLPDPPSTRPSALQVQETEFEKKRGVSRVEIRAGFAQVHVGQLPEPLAESRLRVLEAVKDAGYSIDFLKLTQSGLSFLVSESVGPNVRSALLPVVGESDVTTGRSLVIVHAVNMRDEEGLIARVVSLAIASGAKIDHLGDMHDRLMIATSDEGAVRIAEAIRTNLVEVGP